MRPNLPALALVVLLTAFSPREARAQASNSHSTETATTTPHAGPSDTSPSTASAIPPAEGRARAATRASVTLSGYIEAFYSYNFNQPSNGITNYRGFDNRHNSFSIANAVIDVAWLLDAVSGRLALQVGLTPETYYLAEPLHRSTAGAGGVGPEVWKFIQQANVGWRASLARGLLIEAGVFLSPIGPESLPVRDQWNWSRSSLFMGLPFYHTGLRATLSLTDALGLEAMVCNGWNSVVDNNPEKSIEVRLAYALPERLSVSVLYFGGVERPPGAPEGRPWRHLFDAYVQFAPTPWLSFLVHGDAGFEPNAFGVSYWLAGAIYARVRLARWLYAAVRGDLFHESVAASGTGAALPIFYPAPWVGSATATLELRPASNVSVRLEYRHDHASADIYFRGAIAIDPLTGAFASNARSQDTMTLGAVAWF